MTTTTDLLADLRRLEQYAIAGGADDKLLARVVPQCVALAVGVPMSSADTFLRVLALIEGEHLSVRLACRRVGMARSHFTELRDRWHGITGHDPCERPSLRPGGSMGRTIKTAPITAPDTLTPPRRQTASRPGPRPQFRARMEECQPAQRAATSTLALSRRTPRRLTCSTRKARAAYEHAH